MPDLKTTQEALRSPVDGTELIRLATPGANWQIPLSSISRLRLTGNTTYYIDAVNGNDTTGNGSIGNPWKTLIHADAYIQVFVDLNEFQLELILLPGNYVSPTNMGGYVGGGSISLHGATNVPSLYILNDTGGISACLTFMRSTDTFYRIDNVTFQPLADHVDLLAVHCGMTVYVGGAFGDGLGNTVNADYSALPAGPGHHANGWTSTTGGRLNVFGTVNVTVPTGGNYIHNYYLCCGTADNTSGNSYLNAVSTVNFNAAPPLNPSFFSFAFADTNSLLIINDTFNGPAATTGTKFIVRGEAMISTSADNNYLPGLKPGILSTGGQYT